MRFVADEIVDDRTDEHDSHELESDALEWHGKSNPCVVRESKSNKVPEDADGRISECGNTPVFGREVEEGEGEDEEGHERGER